MADGVGRVSELRVSERPAAVEGQVQPLISVEERPVRMVEEIVAGEAELKLLVFRLPEGEILEYGQVAVEESRSGQRRKDIGALLARSSERREAGSVDVLMVLQTA